MKGPSGINISKTPSDCLPTLKDSCGRRVASLYQLPRGRGARSAGGTTRPDVSRIGALPFQFPPFLLCVSFSHPSSSVSSGLADSLKLCRCCRVGSILELSFASSWSSSTSSPSAVSKSGGAIHSLGTTQGRAIPMLAARFNQAGPGLPVSFSHIYDVKWLQFLVRILYEVPRNSSEAALIIESISSAGANVKPWSTSHLNVPPGGSDFGLVQ